MANDIKTGFIFKDQDDDMHLGIFENGSVSHFTVISDFDGVYNDMLTTKLMIVEVDFRSDDSFLVRDLSSFEIGRPDEMGEFNPTDVTTMLEDLNFPSPETDDMFAGFLKEVKKVN